MEEVFGKSGTFDLNFVRVNAQERYYKKLEGQTEPESKRKIIGEEFIRVFEEEAKKIGAVDFLAQGTIYPDVVESGLGGESTVIKSHHNVGGLPEKVDFKELIEPLRDLFKDEVRKVGLELGLPEYLVFRQPFPDRTWHPYHRRGNGRQSPHRAGFRLHLPRGSGQGSQGLQRRKRQRRTLMPNQYFAALTNMRSVGVMGDERTYDYAVALRAVTTVEEKKKQTPPICWEAENKKNNNEGGGGNRVFYDPTSKPPGTIEFE